MDLSHSYRRFIGVTALSLSLAGCMVGPDFRSPKSPPTNQYTSSPLPAKTARTPNSPESGKSQEFVFGAELPVLWWRIFHSQELNELINEGVSNSPNLRAAKAALVEARENYTAQFGSTLLPSVNGQLSGERQLFNSTAYGLANSSPQIFDLYTAAVNVSYTLDVFGGLRRQLESYGAQIDYEGYEMEAAYLTLTSNIVTTTITIASLEAQIRATNEIIAEEQSELTILGKQLKLGAVSGVDYYTQDTQVEQTRATLPPLLQKLAQSQHALIALLGSVPGQSNIPALKLDAFHLPKQLPVSLPSRLIRQRPDVKAAEALMHAASAQIGVATANLLPQVTLTGAYGWETQTISGLFKNKFKYWDYTGNILQPIFAGGSLRAKRRAAIAAYQQAEEQYRQTVVTAFQNVADSLRAIQHDAVELKHQSAAEVAARKSYQIAKSQFQLGGVSYLYLLNAEKTYQQTRVQRIQAQAARYTDTAALFQSLGGGWWTDCNTSACHA